MSRGLSESNTESLISNREFPSEPTYKNISHIQNEKELLKENRREDSILTIPLTRQKLKILPKMMIKLVTIHHGKK